MTQSMPIAGEIRASWCDEGGRWLLTNTRTAVASRLLPGRTAATVVTLIGSLFGICRTAQVVAAARALEAAEGRPAARSVEACRNALVRLESLREQLLRLSVTLPSALGLPPALDLLRRVQRAEATASRRAGGVLSYAPSAGSASDEPARLLARLRDEFDEAGAIPADGNTVAPRWRALIDRISALKLSSLGAARRAPLELADVSAHELASLMIEEGDRFTSLPTLDGEPRETGAFARNAGAAVVSAAVEADGPGLLARTLAAVVDLDRTLRPEGDGPSEGSADTGPIGPIGHAAVDTARGVLLHAVEIRDERVLRYGILAPTEWNFHPRGAAAEALGCLPSPQEEAAVEARLRTVAAVFDPCVTLRVELPDA